ncbi:MAG: endonuclease/exonuclease/phosphatase family protein [Candidatus Pacearchaeota archaeon]
MRVFSLNIWGGKEFDSLIQYLSNYSDTVDVFCFQEVFDTLTTNKKFGNYRANMLSELKKILPQHIAYFAPMQDFLGIQGADFELSLGIAMFIKKDFKIKEIGEFFLRGHRNSMEEKNDKKTRPYNFQYAQIESKEERYTIAHLHGLWNGEGKTDTDERIEQSKKIKNFIENKNKLIVCGDFNLLPETHSIKMLDEELVNLIKTHKITTTRSKHYLKPERFADYTFVSKDIEVNDFVVPNVDVSDHLPMIIEFS